MTRLGRPRKYEPDRFGRQSYCPTCGAAPGRICRGVTGNQAPKSASHVARIDADIELALTSAGHPGTAAGPRPQ